MTRPAIDAALALPALQLQLTGGDNRGVPLTTESTRGLKVLEDTLGAGALAPHQIVVDTHRAGGAADPRIVAAERRLAAELRREPGRPLVTFYDERSGERVELSVTTYANWVAKAASLLVDEHDLERGDVLLVEAGTIVAADARVVSADALAVALCLDPATVDRKIVALKAQASQTAGLFAALGEERVRQWWSTETFVAADAACVSSQEWGTWRVAA